MEEIADSHPHRGFHPGQGPQHHGDRDPSGGIYAQEKERPPYSFYSTSDSLDEACLAFERVKELTARLATVETSAYRLAESIKRHRNVPTP